MPCSHANAAFVPPVTGRSASSSRADRDTSRYELSPRTRAVGGNASRLAEVNAAGDGTDVLEALVAAASRPRPMLCHTRAPCSLQRAEWCARTCSSGEATEGRGWRASPAGREPPAGERPTAGAALSQRSAACPCRRTSVDEGCACSVGLDWVLQRSSACSRRRSNGSCRHSTVDCRFRMGRDCVLMLLASCWLACLSTPAAGAPTVYFAGTFARFTTADGVEHNVTGVGEWSEGTIKPLGLGLALPQEATTLDYHPSPPECVRRCQNSQTCWTTCTPSTTPALYLGGSFTSANGEEIYRVAVARNRTMLEVDKGVSNTVTVVAVHQPSGLLYMGGLFLDATGVQVRQKSPKYPGKQTYIPPKVTD